MEQFFTILIFIVAVIISAIVRKRKSGDGGLESWPESPSGSGEGGSPPPKRISWEEELKRLLQGDTAAPPTQAPAPPPRVVRQPAPAPRVVKPALAPAPAAPPAKPAPLHQWTQRAPAPVPVLDQSLLALSTQAYGRAQQLDEKVAAQMRETARRVETHEKVVARVTERADVRTALNLLRKAESLRAGLIVSIILGPPKSMEDLSGR